MNRTLFALFLMIALGIGRVTADANHDDVSALIESSCIACHDSGTDTGLDFESLSHDLSDPAVQRAWVKVFDRVASGEMPPESEERPDPTLLKSALDALKTNLTKVSLAKQKLGRVPARRLTKLELGYTLQDLFDVQGDFTSSIPDEVEAGGLDVIGANQRISAVHMEGYLQAADAAMGEAIQLGHDPYRDYGDLADNNFAHLEAWHDKPLNLGGSITRKLKFSPGFVLFADVDYLTAFTYGVKNSGTHRLSANIAAYQATEPVTAKFIVKDPTGGARLVKTIDLLPGEPQSVVFETFLKRGDTPYLTMDARGPLEPGGQLQPSVFLFGGAKNYKGAGMAVTSQRLEGPISSTWPPPGTKALLGDVDWDSADLDDIRQTALRIAPRVFRRPVSDSEAEAFVKLAAPALDEGRTSIDGLKVTLRSMLSSPQFLLFGGKPGTLDDHALANRLSYFLWRSMPDKELFELAAEGTLSEPTTLTAQVARMLDDQKSSRFVEDFVGQWLMLNKINATSPDGGLYPEFGELLGHAMPQETHLFFASLIEDNLPARNLIDSDFTFVNRRLAEHYGIDDVVGQDFRRVTLRKNGARGGVLTHAGILKATANGTSTSPVTRGNFVLTNFLGTPPSPPPPSVGSIEPDTRGQTTIREILAAHRDTETCNQCHREIDPPGFALESFDPIGGFRRNYRASGGEQTFAGFTTKLPPKQGPPVDPSGVTPDGEAFADIRDYRKHLLAKEDTVVRNFVSQLLMFSTGGEIEFADREVIDQILAETKPNHYPVRDLIHAVVQSRLFREK